MRTLIYIIIFFSFFDLFTQLPVMSTYAESFGASTFITGLAVGMYSFSNTFGNILSGLWTDRKGPYLVLVIGLITTSLSLFSYFFIHTPLSLLLIRFLHGLVSGLIIPAAFTFLANSTSKKSRGKGGAISGAFIGISAIAGPAFSGILASKTSVPFVFSITACFMIVIGLVSLFSLRKLEFHKVKTVRESIPQSTSLRSFLNNIGLIKAFSGAFFLMFSQGVIAYLLPLRVQDLGYDTKITGTLLSTFGIVAVLIFVLPTNRIFDKVSPLYTLALGIGLMGVSQLALSLLDSLFLLYVAMAIYGGGFGFLFPSINSLLIDSTDEKVRGKAYGYFYAFFSFGVVIGSTLLGILSLGIQQGFLLTSIILLLVSMITLFGRKQKVIV